MESTARRLQLTPELAQELLDSNSTNRPVREAKWRGISRDITEGRYVPNFDPIVVWVHHGVKRLMNGQHRCLAVVDCGIAVDVLYVETDDEGSMLTMDTGAPRTFKDYLTLRAVPDQAGLAAATRILWRYQHGTLHPFGDFTKRERATQSELWELFLKHESTLRAGTKAAHAVAKAHPQCMNRSTLAVAYAVLGELSTTWRDNFFTGLRGGSGAMATDDPRAVLIRRLEKQKRLDRLDGVHQLAYLLKSWNAFVAGKGITNLSWHPVGHDGKGHEPFPVPRQPEF